MTTSYNEDVEDNFPNPDDKDPTLIYIFWVFAAGFIIFSLIKTFLMNR
jgi:hypothetical protein